jgi:predicted RNase H-like HicB family nuclease
MKYAVIVEQAGDNYAAHAPDVPACIATGDTPEEAVHELQGALVEHLALLREAGLPVPRPSTLTAIVDIEEAAPAA